MLLSVIMVFYFIPTVIYAEVAEAVSSQASEQITADPEGLNLDKAIYEDVSLREESVKHFRLPDGSMVAAQYAYPVHYVREDGSLEDIDNTLAEASGGVFADKDARIKFSKKITGGAVIFELKDGSTKLTMSLPDAIKGTRGVMQNTEDDENDTELQKMMRLEKLTSSVYYENILKGVDVEYLLHSSIIKENIIVKERAESYSYTFELKLNGLTAELCDSGDVEITDRKTGAIKYVIPAPTVYDAEGVPAPDNASAYTLTQLGVGKYYLTVSVSSEWMNAEERAFPVTVDPTVGQYTSSMVDTYISSSSPTVSYYTATSLKIGMNDIFYWRMLELPELPDSAYVTSAMLSLYCTDVGTTINTYGNDVKVAAYRVKNAWGSPMTYNNYLAGASAFDNDDTLDVNTFMLGAVGRYAFDITDALRGWYSQEIGNYGVAIRALPDGVNTIYSRVTVNSLEMGTERPQLAISYKNMTGVEDYWPSISQSAGAAGSGLINLATGMLSFAIPTLTSTDRLMPVTPTLVYNASMAGQDYKASTAKVGYSSVMAPTGMMLNLAESVIAEFYIDPSGVSRQILIYSDSDGTEHYMRMVDDANMIYEDEDGLGLIMDNDTTTVSITDRNKVKRIFTAIVNGSSWYLSRIEDRNGNAAVITVDSAYRPTAVSLDPAGSVGSIEMLRLVYNSDGRLSMVYNPSSREAVVMRYSATYDGDITSSGGKYLVRMDLAHGSSSVTEANWASFRESASSTTNIAVDAVSEYRYDQSGRLIGAEDGVTELAVRYVISGGKTMTAYESGDVDIVAPGAFQLARYGTGYTDVISAGADDIMETDDDVITRYVLDSYGRAVSMYSFLESGGEILGASYGEYSSSEKSKNSIEENVVLGGSSVNYMLNGSFEELQSPTAPISWTTSGTIRVVSSSSGNGSGHMELSMTPAAGATSEVRQSLTLATGEYVLSFPFITQSCGAATATVSIVGVTDTTFLHTEELNLNPTTSNGIYSYFETLFTVETAGEYTVKITISNAASATKAAILRVDDVMLERGVGASDYSLIQYGSFETSGAKSLADVWLAEGSSSSITVSSSDQPFGDVLFIPANTDTSFIKQRIFEATDEEISGFHANNPMTTYTVSGYAKGVYAVQSGNLPFRLRLEIAYYQGNDENGAPIPDHIVNCNVDFIPGIDGWQYATGTFDVYPDEEIGYGGEDPAEEDGSEEGEASGAEGAAGGTTEEPSFLYTVIRYIDLYVEYLDQPNGFALFDNVSVIAGHPGTQWVRYNKDTGLPEITASSSYRKYQIYDERNNVVRVADTNGDVIDYTYTDADMVATQTVYRSAEPLVYTYKDYAGVGDTSVVLTPIVKSVHTYNEYGLNTVTETYVPDSAGNMLPQYYKYRSEYTYQTSSGSKIFGAPLEETDLTTYKTAYYYDEARGLLLASINLLDETGLCYSYDALGRMTEVRPATYNADGTYTTVTNSARVSYSYSDKGSLTGISNVGNNYVFTYGEFQQLTSVKAGGKVLATYEYNEYNGKLIKITYGNGLIEEYEYNDLEMISKVWYTKSGGTKTLAYEYTYTADGELQRVTDHTSEISTVFKYDKRGRLTNLSSFSSDEKHDYSSELIYDDSFDRVSVSNGRIQYGASDQYTQQIEYHYFYNSDGKMNRLEYASGDSISMNIDYAFDRYSRQKSESYTYSAHNASFSVSYSYGYHFETIDNVTYTTNNVEHVRKTINGTETYEWIEYDDSGNISLYMPRWNYIPKIEYYYDDLGQLIRVDDKNLWYSYFYTYDDAGNILTSGKCSYTTDVDATPTSVNTYTYGVNGWKDTLLNYNGVALTYDAIGNPLSYYNGTAYTFTWSGRQMQTATKGGVTYTFAYNADGKRISKTSSDGVLSTYVYDGDLLVYESRGSEEFIYIYDAKGSPAGMQYRNNTYTEGYWDVFWFERNAFGDVVSVYDESGVELVHYRYDPWGVCTTSYYNSGASSPATKNPFRYRGYYYDSDLGFYYLLTRYYDPVIGRFISPDRYDLLTATQGGLTDKNLYAYCDNNPISRKDSDGEYWNILIGAGIGAFVGVATQFTTDLVTSAIDGELSFSHWSSYLGAAVGGAVGGAIDALEIIPSPIADGIGAGVSTIVTAVSYNIESLIVGRDDMYSSEQIFYDTFNNSLTSAMVGFGYKESRLSKVFEIEDSNELNKAIIKGLGSFVSGLGIATAIGITESSEFNWPNTHSWDPPNVERGYP